MIKSFQAICRRLTAMAFIHELLLGLRIVHQQHISIAPPRGVERLAGALRDDMNRDPGLRRELRQNVCQQAGGFDRGGGGQNDGLRRGGTGMEGDERPPPAPTGIGS